jgi:RNA polymerase sigma-70 factor, ECF subfamily
MSADHQPLRPANEQQAHFLRLFLACERDVFRSVAVLVPSVDDADEIVQQTAVALWEKFEQYDPQQPFAPWACGFAVNIARQWMARRQRWKSVLEGNLTNDLLRRRSELRPVLNERLVNLERCIERLPDEQRRMLEQYYFRRMPIDSIAHEFRRSVDAVYKSLQRIRRSLRGCMERTGDGDIAAT